MSEESGQRIAAYGGIAFVVLAVIGAFIPSQPPAFDDSVARMRQYFTDHHTAINIGNVLTAAAIIVVFAFIGGMRVRIARAEGEGGYMAQLFFGATLVTMAMVLASVFLTAAMNQVIAGLDDSTVRAFFEITFILAFGGAGFTTAVLLFAASAVILRTGMFAAWVGWLGMLGVLANLIGAGAFVVQATNGLAVLGLIGFLVLALWVLVVSILVLMRAGQSSTAGARVPSAA